MNTPSLHLQGIGNRNAVKASDLVVGDIMICNFGDVQTVVNVDKHKSGKTMFIDIECGGVVYKRCRYGANRLVAVKRVN